MSLIVTRKQLDTIALSLKPHVRMIALEGPTRSSKTADMIQAFYWCVFDSNERYHAICGENYDTINRNILYSKDVGLLETHPELVMKKKQNGGYYVAMETPKGKKEIVIASYGDASKWKKILGGTIDVILIDEANIADPDFIDETFARQTSCDNPKTFMTLNGDKPEHTIYQNYINFCKIVGDAPSSTKGLMSEFQQKNGTKKGYYYMFYAMTDNPIMSTDKLKKAMSIYPVGSYYYITKLLGERGQQGELVYGDYMNKSLIVNGYDMDLYRFTIGIDIGENRASNVFTLVGWGKDFRECVILNCLSFVKVGYDAKKERLHQWLADITKTIRPNLIEGIFVDSAEANFIRDLQEPIKAKFKIDVLPAYKATIKERIDMNIIGFSTGKVRIDRSCLNVYEAFNQTVWAKGKTGQERLDDNTVKIDILDSVEYAQTRHMKALMRAGVV